VDCDDDADAVDAVDAVDGNEIAIASAAPPTL
jgi:hypothetical protein